MESPAPLPFSAPCMPSERCAETREVRDHHSGDEADEDGSADVPVGAEAAEAVGGIVDVERRHLPSHLQADQRDRQEKDQVRTCEETGNRPQYERAAIERPDPAR